MQGCQSVQAMYAVQAEEIEAKTVTVNHTASWPGRQADTTFAPVAFRPRLG